MSAFLGALMANLIPVPACPPDPSDLRRRLPGFKRLAEVSGAQACLTDTQFYRASSTAGAFTKIFSIFRGASAAEQWPKLTWIVTSDLPTAPVRIPSWEPIDTPDLAYIQFTSGSTQDPKGTLISHANLLENLDHLSRQALIGTGDEVVVSWLPYFHDMGLAGKYLVSIFLGIKGVFFSPLGFIKNPNLWMQLCSRYRATHTGAPNFGYEIAATKYDGGELDLSSLRFVLSGAEHIKASTMRKFVQVFGPSRFPTRAFRPSYGLAENVLIVSSCPGQDNIEDYFNDENSYVYCGAAKFGVDIRLIDIQTGEDVTNTGKEGEIWLYSESRAMGYYNLPDVTKETFENFLPHAPKNGFLRTGDLGKFVKAKNLTGVDEMQLIITGRLKELIIVNGRNVYPHDVEVCFDLVGDGVLRTGCTVVFGVTKPGASGPNEGGVDAAMGVVACAELRDEVAKNPDQYDLPQLCRNIARNVFQASGLALEAIHLIAPRQVPKSTSGKIQRTLAKSLYAEKKFKEVYSTTDVQSFIRGDIIEFVASSLNLSATEKEQFLSTGGNLLEAGVDSLALAQLVGRVKKQYGVTVDFETLFDDFSVDGVVQTLITTKQASPRAGQSSKAASPRETLTSFPATPGQSRLFLLSTNSKDVNRAYHLMYKIPITLTSDGADFDRLNAAIQAVVHANDILRTVFDVDDQGEVQGLISPPTQDEEDRIVESQSEQKAEKAIASFAAKTMDIRRQVFDYRLFTVSPSKCYLALKVHHIAFDGPSAQIFMQQIVDAYDGNLSAEEIAQFSHLAVDQSREAVVNAGEEAEHNEKLRSLWSLVFSSPVPILELPQDGPQAGTSGYGGELLTTQLDKPVVDLIRSFARSHNATEFVVLMALFASFMSRLCNQDDLLVASPISMRNKIELQNTIGFMINTTIRRFNLGAPAEEGEVKTNSPASFLEVLSSAMDQHVGYLNDPTADFQIMHDLATEGLSQSQKRDALQIWFNYHRFVTALPGAVDKRGMKLDQVSLIPTGSTKFPLGLEVDVEDDSLVCQWEFSTRHIHPQTMKSWASAFPHFIASVLHETTKPVKALALVDAASALFKGPTFGQPVASKANGLTLHGIFRQTAKRYPSRTCLADSSGLTMTYKETDIFSSYLAGIIAEKAKSTDRRLCVALAINRGPLMVNCMLAVLKSGCHFVPMDLTNPLARSLVLLNEIEPFLLIVDDSTREAYESCTVCEKLNLSSVWSEFQNDATAKGVEAAEFNVDPSTLAYMLYTSGSTGTPKACMLEHRNSVSSVFSHVRQMEWSEGGAPRVLQFSRYTFDHSILEIFGTFASRGTLVSASMDELLSDLPKVINWAKANILVLTPTVALTLPPPDDLPTVSLIVLSGERTPEGFKKTWLSSSRGVRLFNLYGPTEAGIHTFIHEMSLDLSTATIGAPLGNTGAYLLDEFENPVPQGAIGEIWVMGEHIGRGYFKREELTARTFKPLAIHGSNVVFHKTGDIGRQLPSGEYVCLGRKDRQIKVRGVRVEPEEIEETIRKCTPEDGRLSIGRTAVILKTLPGMMEPQLVAFWEVSSSVDEDRQGSKETHPSRSFRPLNADDALYTPSHALSLDIRSQLSRLLPPHMIPFRIVPVAKLPLTSSGKTDRSVLAACVLPDLATQAELKRAEVPTIPQKQASVVEELTDIFSKLLGHNITPDVDLFEQGLTSLSAMRSLAMIRNGLGVQQQLSVADLMRCPNIKALSEHIGSKTTRTQDPQSEAPGFVSDAAHQHEPFPLTELQSAYVVGGEDGVELGGISPITYLELCFDKGSLDMSRLQNAWDALVERHDVLRTVVDKVASTQRILPASEVSFPITALDLTEEAEDAQEVFLEHTRFEARCRRFELDTWPLFNIAVTEASHTYLHISVHLIIVDAKSFVTLMNDFAALYTGQILPPLGISYRDYVNWHQNGNFNAARLAEAKSFWEERVKTLPLAPAIPSNPERPQGDLSGELLQVRHLSHDITRPVWDEITRRSKEHGIMPSALLITAFSEVLSRWSENSNFAVNLTLFNREPIHPSVGDVVGDFTGGLLFEVDCSAQGSFLEKCKLVQASLKRDLQHSTFGSVSVLRELRRTRPYDDVMMPIVMTCLLEDDDSPGSSASNFPAHVVSHRFTQTPQVSIDFQVVLLKDGLHLHLDFFDVAYPSGLPEMMFKSQCAALESLESLDWIGHTLSVDLGDDLLARKAANQTASSNILAAISGDNADPPRLLHEAFFKMAKIRPDAVAIAAHDGNLTYEQLAAAAYEVSRQLKEAAPGHSVVGQVVPVAIDRSWRQIAAVLGVLHAGGIYLPLSSNVPIDRATTIISDAGCTVIVGLDGSKQVFADVPGVHAIVSLTKLSSNEEAEEHIAAASDPSGPAYVIYTSGSTGKPKGVLISHDAALNTIADIISRFGITADDVCIGMAKLDFDLSVYDIFGTLSIGGCLALPPAEAQEDSDTWVDFVAKHKVTVWNTVPAMMELLIASARAKRQEKAISSIRIGLLSGDKVSLSLVQQLAKSLPMARVWSLGGATEAAIWSLFNPLSGPHLDFKSPIFGGRVIYGVPLANQQLHVLDSSFNDCPTFVPGQLYISGKGLAIGYTDEEKTRQAFVFHPRSHERLYNTGDLCRYLPDGRVEIIGRTDFQRKIRGGHRVELGEIERHLSDVRGVSQAVVDVRNDILVAYLSADKSSHQSEAELRSEEGFEIVHPDDRLSFKLEHRGILRTTEIKPSLSVSIPFGAAAREAVVCRKSYRTFASISEDLLKASSRAIVESARTSVNKLISTTAPTEKSDSPISAETLARILSVLQFYTPDQDNSGALMKARYPSAGSSYSVRTYVIGPSQQAQASAVYYVDPVAHRLIFLRDVEVSRPAQYCLFFTSYRPAIFPLYGQHSRQFAKIELGYVIGLLTLSSQTEGIDLRYSEGVIGTTEALGLSPDETLLGHAILGQDGTVRSTSNPRAFVSAALCVQTYKSVEWSACMSSIRAPVQGAGWSYQPGTVHFHENADLIHGAPFLLAVSCDDILQAAAFSQIFMEEALAHNFGFCHIPHVSDAFSQDFGTLTGGRTPDFILVGGIISQDMKDSVLTQAAPDLTKRLLRSYLEEKLPRYMVPDVYIPLPTIPLTANGKVDRKRLAHEPLPASAVAASSGEAPLTEAEKRLAIIWADILATSPSNVTRDASFFYLGGHSMSALKLQQAINEGFGVNVALKALFNNPTLETMARFIDAASESQIPTSNSGEAHLIVDVAARHEPFPTTQIQQAYLLGRSSSFKLGSVATHSYLEFHQTGSLPLELWAATFKKLIRRHEALRLVFDADNVTQKILPETVADDYQIQVTNISVSDGEEMFELMRQTTQDEMSHQVLDTAKWPLFDIRVTTFDDHRFVVHSSFDMLIMDFYSSAILASDLQRIIKGAEIDLPPVDVSFRDYVLALDRFSASQIYAEHKAYWLNRVDSFPNAPNLPANPDVEDQGAQTKFARVEDSLSLTELQNLNVAAKDRSLISTSVISAIFSLALACWAESKHFALNLTVFDRKRLHKNINNIMGDFTSSLLLEVDTAKEQDFNGLVANVNSQLLEDLSHAAFTGIDFLRALRSASNSDRLMGVVLTSVLNDFDVSADLASLDSVVGTLEHSITQTSQVTLDFQALKTASGLLIRWDYVQNAFPADLIPQIHGTFMKIARRLASADASNWSLPVAKLLPLSPLSSIESLPASFVDGPMLLHEGFHQTALSRGSLTAVVSATNTGGERRITYSELAVASQQISLMLSDVAKPNQPVAVLCPRGWLAISALLGVLYAGSYYLPLDVELPPQRIKAILAAVNCSLILTTSASRDRLLGELDMDIQFVVLDEARIKESSEREEMMEWSPKQTRRDIAYTIFTSGSTGTPKGVVITHEAAMNTINDINQRFQVTHMDVVLGLSKFNFDLSVYDIFGTFAAGGTLVMPPANMDNDPDVWASLATRHGVTFWNSVPMMMQMLLGVETDNLTSAIASLRVCLLSGDRIPMQLPRRLAQVAPQTRIISLGGATEASIWSIIHEITPSDLIPSARSIPYGKPLTNQEILVVDMARKPWALSPTWAVGSIFIAGVGLAAGYVDAKQTARAFFTLPESNARFYDTGDLGRLLPSGEVDILGRRDLQVKVRGHRIELEEIEYHLLKLDAISEAVVIVASGQLAAYYVLSPSESDDLDIVPEAKRQLTKALPGYMVPSFFVKLTVLPLSRNGKVDRKALPPVDVGSKNDRRPPQTSTERALVGMCADIFQLPEDVISLSSGFVAMGGHSLTAIRLRAAIREVFNVKVDLADILSDAPLEELAQTIDAASAALPASERTAAKGIITPKAVAHNSPHRYEPFPLTPIQEAYLLGRTSHLDLGGVSTHVYLEFISTDLNVAQLEEALNILLLRHDSLRLVFDLSTQTQRVLPIVPRFEIPLNNDGEEEDHEFTEAVRQHVRSEMSHQVMPADKWPLFDIRLTRLSKDTSVIHMSIDMLIMDFSSIMILTDELGQILSGPTDRAISLKPLGITFRDYVVYKGDLKKGEEYDVDKAYWTGRAGTFPAGPKLPLLVRPESIAKPTFSRLEDVVARSDRQKLEKLCKAARLTPTAVLAALFCMALERFSESHHFSINLTVFDREPLHPDIYNLVGDFTTSLFMEYSGSSIQESFAERARVVQRQLLQDLQHGLYSGVDFARHLRHARTDDVTIPVVFTSVMTQASGTDQASSLGELDYSISQTPQIWIDFQAQILPSGDLALRFEYLDQIFPPDMISALHSCVLTFIRRLLSVDDLEQVSTDSLNSCLDLDPLRKGANDTSKELHGFTYIHEGFHNQLSRHYDKIAIVSGDNEGVTYGNLYQTASSLAKVLVSSHRKDGAVAILLERSWQQAAAGLASGYAGIPFVPLDADIPPGRLATILRGANCSSLIARSSLIHRYTELLGEVQVIDIDAHDARANMPEAVVIPPFSAPRGVSVDDPAYVIFTSGSTGTPKGVVISHRGATNTIKDIIDRFNLDHHSVLLNLARFNFDLSIFDFFGGLGMGALMVMPAHKDQNEPSVWLDLLRRHRVTCWNSVPTMMRMAADTAAASNREDDFRTLRLVMLSGDKFPVSLASTLLSVLPKDVMLVSLGGATEASIWSIYHDVTPNDVTTVTESSGAILYGKPLANQQFGVLDANFNPRPTWVPGELVIMGIGLAIGYTDRDLTAKSFVVDPRDASCQRMYRTGDMGRYLPSGEIEFLGRRDAQVKIRGHRIELGEIEHWLQDIYGIKDAVCDVHDGRLGAFVVSAFPLPEPDTLPPYDLLRSWADRAAYKKAKAEKLAFNLPTHQHNVDKWPAHVLMTKARKSQRKFGGALAMESLESLLKATSTVTKVATAEKLDWPDAIVYALHPLMPVVTGDIAGDQLKFRYPSAGSTYSVRVCLSVKGFNGIHDGIYTWSELSGKLDPKSTLPVHRNPHAELIFYCQLPSIAPLYGSVSVDFARHEAGYMTALVQDAAASIGLSADYTAIVQGEQQKLLMQLGNALDAGDVLIGKLSLSQDHPITTPAPVEISLFVQSGAPGAHGWYTFWDGSVVKVQDIQPQFAPGAVYFTDNSALMDSAQFLLGVRSSSVEDAAAFCQRLMESAVATSSNLGFCHIPHVNGNFDHDFAKMHSSKASIILAGGVIAAPVDESPQVADYPSARITKLLKAQLPSYMIPAFVEVVQHIPLSANGKVDRKQLRAISTKLTTTNDDVFEPLEGTAEQTMAAIWAEVLGVDLVTLHKNSSFFELGGHSLLAIRLQTSIEKAFRVRAALRLIFEHPTLSKLTGAVLQLERVTLELDETNDELGDRLEQDLDPDAPFSLTPIQQAYLLGRSKMFTLGGVSTHSYMELQAASTMTVDKLERLINALVTRHGALRLVFDEEEQTQRVLSLDSVPTYKVDYIDLSEEKDSNMATEVLGSIRDELSHQVLPASQWPLFDIRATRTSQEEMTIHLSIDMLIIDFFSSAILAGDIKRLIANEPLPPLQGSFRECVLAQERLKYGQLFNKQRDYWESRASTFPKGPLLPLACEPAELLSQKFDRVDGEIAKEDFERLQQLCRANSVSPSAFLATTFAKVLARFSEQPHFAINMTVFNRPAWIPGAEALVGDFTSSILLEVKPDSEKSMADAVKDTNERMLTDLSNSAYGGVDFIRHLRSVNEEEATYPVVFTSVLNDIGASHELRDVENVLGKMTWSMSQTPQVWIDFQAQRLAEGGVSLRWDFVKDLFRPNFIQTMHAVFSDLISQALAENDWSKRIPLDIQLRADPALHSHLEEPTQRDLTLFEDPHQLLHEGFHRQLHKSPASVAIVSREASLTYKELGQYVANLAERIAALSYNSSRTSRRIGIYVGKSWVQVAASLAILFAGQSYVPLDVDQPWERARQIIEDSGCWLVLCASSTTPYDEKESPVQMLDISMISTDNQSAIPAISRLTLTPTSSKEEAYVIFTSGSTGKPKGVMISHEGAVNTIDDLIGRFNLDHEDVFLGLAKLSFDLSVFDIFASLAVGGTLVIPTAGNDPEHWLELVTRHGVTIWNSVPMMFEMAEASTSAKALEGLRIVLLSGDRVPVSLVQKAEARRGTTVYSGGGATEASIWSILYPISQLPEDAKFVPYGKAMVNQTVQVLTSQLEPAPLWVPGQLFIGGVGLAIGYTDAEKTREAFIHHPRTGVRLYQTGDWGRLLPSGDIEFLGRRDQQLKIRGHRIELGEIEHHVKHISDVQDAVVNPVEFGISGKQLVAYLVADTSAASTEGMIMDPLARATYKNSLQQKLHDIGSARNVFKFGDLSPDELDSLYARKSHRRFDNSTLVLSDVEEWLHHARDSQRLLDHPTRPVDRARLCALLATFTAIPEPTSRTLKYRYPSGGSTYSVRVYVTLHDERLASLLALRTGTYYINPHTRELRYVCSDDGEGAHGAVSVAFVAAAPILQPIYGPLSTSLVHSEVGYMMDLFEQSCAEQGISFARQPAPTPFPPAQLFEDIAEGPTSLIVSYGIDAGEPEAASTPITAADRVLLYVKKDAADKALAHGLYDITHRVNESASAESVGMLDRAVDLDEKSAAAFENMVAHGANGPILEECGFVIFFASDPARQSSEEAIQNASYLASRMHSTSPDHLIGTCPMPFANKSTSDVLRAVLNIRVDHVLLGGGIDERARSSSAPSNPMAGFDSVRHHLSKKLPPYMVPSRVMWLPTLPLSANGKIDRKALPAPLIMEPESGDAGKRTASIVEPKSDLEAAIREQWSKVLSIPENKISCDASFFALGANSLDAVRMATWLQKTYKVKLNTAALMKSPTIAFMATEIEAQLAKASTVKTGGFFARALGVA
ncbi:hypothetical protein BOTBODRAFT_125510 [Botryobasidium botryosum FD-172 SS1]|uniref:Carrier domain-containing protein n=1 Tax=Botryobasidium botryosum (strain FD-172 SS1) TaxID=930990 RepID=A0A067N770_BOTB1|nr:hypothetical protein BOTBODRAFT_125510 [Botryobasidium botryosum FD-172 SS1]